MLLLRTKVLVTGAAAAALAVAAPALAQGQSQRETPKRDSTKTDTSKTAPVIGSVNVQIGQGQDGGLVLTGGGLRLLIPAGAGVGDSTPGQAQAPGRFQVRSSNAPATPDSARTDSTKKTGESGQKPAR